MFVITLYLNSCKISSHNDSIKAHSPPNKRLLSSIINGKPRHCLKTPHQLHPLFELVLHPPHLGVGLHDVDHSPAQLQQQ